MNNVATPTGAAVDVSAAPAGHIRFTLNELKRMEGAMGRLARMDGLPLKTSFKVSRLLRILMPEYEAVNKQMNELVKKHGVAAKLLDGSDDPVNYTVPTANVDVYQKDVEDYLGASIDVPFSPMKLEDLGTVSLTPGELFALEKIIIE